MDVPALRHSELLRPLVATGDRPAAPTASQSDELKLTLKSHGVRNLFIKDLDRLLAKAPEVLGVKDKDGVSVGEHLQAIATMPLPPDIKRDQFLEDIVERLIDPGEINQSDRGTCAATTVEHILFAKDPGEALRLLRAMADPSAPTIQLRSGKPFKRAPGSEKHDHSFRSPVDRLFQSSLANRANTFFTYDNHVENNKDWTFAGQGGNSTAQIAKLMTDLTGRKYKEETCVFWGAKTVFAKVEQAVKNGHYVTVGVNFKPKDKWLPYGHALLVTGITNGKVQLWNPWGIAESCGRDGPTRTCLDSNGRIEIDYATFLEMLQSAALPA